VKCKGLPPLERLALCLAVAWPAPGALAAELPDEPRPAWAAPRPALDTTLRVVELPADAALPRSRKHHALTWRNDALTRVLGNGGLSGADCHNRVRLPTRIRTVPGTGRTGEIQLQLAIGCSF
jgi:hypothetical protein